MNPTYILGINAYHADASAVLLRDGELMVALEEERFTRLKHSAGFPERAISACLAFAGISGPELQHVAISRDPRANLLRKARFALRNRNPVRHIIDRTLNLSRVHGVRETLARALEVPDGRLPRLHFVEHHPAHLASAFFVSPFETAAVCSLDGFGDFLSTTSAEGKANRLDILSRVAYPHSLGLLYTAVTQYLGFRAYGDEFKVMGLAPYGEPTHLRELGQLVTLLPQGGFELNRRYFTHWERGVRMEWEGGAPAIGTLYSPEFEQLLGPARAQGEPITDFHENVARSLQEVYEKCAFHVLQALWERTRNRRLCLAGGCAMNSVANGRIRANTPFEEVYVQPAAGDAGTALGAAFNVWHEVLGHPRSFVMRHAYWGTEYGTELDLASLPASDSRGRFEVETITDESGLCRKAAALIAEGKVLGWFQGRMEWGARALGNRSILADPRRADMRETINSRIKFREKFRPFAPSVLAESLSEFFENAAPDQFMQQVYPVRPAKRELIPAVIHVDGSGRLHSVEREHNPLFHLLISAFRDLTDVPVLLNTSFNENEPIVETPAQAIDCFLRTRMDALVIDRVMLRRTGP